jgi:hypothetical protein
MDGIVFGRPWTDVLSEVVARLGARRIFVPRKRQTSKSLSHLLFVV